mmetsp:Transcript_19979/g.24363  ORF Transcript_19979/g.24363 Transcript_19979/m.24363 type:complete len:118 (+) Transcript_19979:130-483(+)
MVRKAAVAAPPPVFLNSGSPSNMNTGTGVANKNKGMLSRSSGKSFRPSSLTKQALPKPTSHAQTQNDVDNDNNLANTNINIKATETRKPATDASNDNTYVHNTITDVFVTQMSFKII